MMPRLLDIEFLPLKPTFKLLRLLEAGGNFTVPGREIFRPLDGKFSVPVNEKFSIPMMESFPYLILF